MEEISFKMIFGHFNFKIIEKSSIFYRVKGSSEFMIFKEEDRIKCLGFSKEGLTVFSKKILIFHLSNSFQTNFEFDENLEAPEFVLKENLTLSEAKLSFLKITNLNNKSTFLKKNLSVDFLSGFPFKGSFYTRKNGYNKETLSVLVKDERLTNVIDFSEDEVNFMWSDVTRIQKFEHSKSKENVLCFNPFSFFIYVQDKFVPNHDLYFIHNPYDIFLNQDLFQIVNEKRKDQNTFILNKNNLWELENMLFIINYLFSWEDIGIRLTFQKSKTFFQIHLEFDRKKVKVSELTQFKLDLKKKLELIHQDIFGLNQKLLFTSKRIKFNLQEFFVFEIPLKVEFIEVLVETLFKRQNLEGLELTLLEGTNKATNELKAI